MFIKKRTLNEFMREYDERIGTDYEFEDWDGNPTGEGLYHVYGFDIETAEEDRALGELIEKYGVEND